ncbi:hypothetical protein ACXDF8_21385 [Mycolicibacterium sp. CBM1]
MTLAATPESDGREFAIEHLSTGVFASGFGQLGDGRSFSFQVRRAQLAVEVYHPRLAGPVPHEEDVIAVATRNLTDFDVDDERSLSAAVRDAIAAAQPVARPAR